MDLPAQVKSVVELVDFWDELGSSMPHVLMRMGTVLSACAVLDEQVESAIRCAVERTRERLGSPDHANAFADDDELRPRLAAPAVTAEQANGAAPEAPHLCSSESDSESVLINDSNADDDDDDDGAKNPLAVLIPCWKLISLAPGLGPCCCRNLWISFSLCCVLFKVTAMEKLNPSDGIWFTSPGHPFLKVNDVLLSSICIPMVIGIHKMAHHELVLSRLRDDCGREDSRKQWARFVRKLCLGSAGVTTAYLFLNATFGAAIFSPTFFQDLVAMYGCHGPNIIVVLHVLCWAVYILHVSAFMFIFMIVWRVTWNELDGFCAGFESASSKGWANVTREYNKLDAFFQQIWRFSSAGLGVSMFFVTMCIDMLRFSVYGLSTSSTPWSEDCFTWASMSAGLFFTVLYLLAKMSGMSRLNHFSDESVAGIATNLAATIPKEQHASYLVFLQCLSMNPVRIRVHPFGKITMKMFYYYVRAFVILVPLCVGIARSQGQSGDPILPKT